MEKSTKPEIVGYTIKRDTALNKNSASDGDPGSQATFYSSHKALLRRLTFLPGSLIVAFTVILC